MTAYALQFRNGIKKYEKKRILNGIDLKVAHGEFFGLVGLNGAGKTTLIKCLLDFCCPNTGTKEIFGKNNRETQVRSPLAFLPGRFIPPYFLTGVDFLKYVLKLQESPFSASDADAMLKALDLDASALIKPVRSYSKGMTQKLGLGAYFFLARKKLYVLGEPMSGFVPRARSMLKAQLNTLRVPDCTLFFSSRALTDVEEICDRMAISHDGQLRFVGSPAECKQAFSAPTLEQAYMKCVS